MKKQKKILFIIVIALIIVLILLGFFLIMSKTEKDIKQMDSFEYYSGTASHAIQLEGHRDGNFIDIAVTRYDSGSQYQDSITLTLEEFQNIYNLTKEENCSKQTYEYQCGISDGCMFRAFSISFGSEEVCYQVNNEILDSFNNLTSKED